MRKLKVIFAVLISALPLNALRVFGYRLLGYKIRGAHIGFGTVIAVDEAIFDGGKIGPFNFFAGPMTVHIQQGASIGNRNEFICGYWTLRPEYQSHGYERTLEIEKDALITSRHYFDLAGKLTLGDRSWIAGIGSQFWTHGAGEQERNIVIGSDCYIGSAVRFSPGACLGNHVLVAMGSVVSGELAANYALVGGVPAKVLKTDYHWKDTDAR